MFSAYARSTHDRLFTINTRNIITTINISIGVVKFVIVTSIPVNSERNLLIFVMLT